MRDVIARDFGTPTCRTGPRFYHNKSKNAQEAHEAMRPTVCARPPRVARYLEPTRAPAVRTDLEARGRVPDGVRRTELNTVVVDLRPAASTASARAGTTLSIRLPRRVRGRQGPHGEDDDEGGMLPAMKTGDRVPLDRIHADQHFTEPPPRFTEAALVKALEEYGIGRPSTYASILAVLRERDYVRLDKKRLIPEDKGRLVTAFLESFFTRYVGYDFTAALEEKLDLVSNHELDWKQVLRDFWVDFSGALAGIKDLRTTQVLDSLNELLGPHIFPAKEDGSNPRACPSCGTASCR